MSEYAPTTTEVMAAYVIGEVLTSPGFPVSEAEACFQNWLNTHDSESLQRIRDLGARNRGVVSDYEAQYRRADEAEAERDAVYAVIAEVRAWNLLLNGTPRYRECGDILAKSPADALAEHDREVATTAWDEGFDSAAEEGWRAGEAGLAANPYRIESLAAAHTAALAAQNTVYRATPRPDGEGE